MKKAVGLLTLVFSTLLASAASAQPAEECAGADLDPGSSLPFDGTFTATSSDFNLFGHLCAGTIDVDGGACTTAPGNCVGNEDSFESLLL